MADEYRLAALYLEALTEGDSDARVAALYLEVLTSDLLAARPLLVTEADSSAVFAPTIVRVVTVPFVTVADTGGPYPPATLEFLTPAVPYEWNPFRPDVPQGLASESPGLYDYLRDQAELIREQHNHAQAGDSTFPWQMISTAGERAVHTLGSLSRFVHPDHGLILGRFVQFSSAWIQSRQSVVGHDRLSAAWVVSNSRSDLWRVVGVAGPAATSLAGLYGWALTHGVGPFSVVVESAAQPARGQELTWDAESGLLITGAGPHVARVITSGPFAQCLNPDTGLAYSPARWRLPSGSWFIDVSGVTQEYLESIVAAETASLGVRVTALEAALESEVSWAAQIAAIEGSITSLSGALGLESSARAVSDAGLGVRITSLEVLAGVGYVTLAAFDALDLRVTTLEGTVTADVAALAALSASSNLRLNDLESWQTVATAQISGLVSSLAGFDDPTFTGLVDAPATYAGAALYITRVNAGESALEFAALTAGLVGFTPTGTIAAVTVAAALAELDSEKMAVAGGTFTGDVAVPDEAYDSTAWNGSLEVPTKNALRDKIETLAVASHRGALVHKAADQTTANYTTATSVAWDSEVYDTDSIHDNATNNSRCTVPSGVSYVELFATLSISAAATADWISLRLLKNGAADVGLPFLLHEGGSVNQGMQIASPVLAVTPGDYFQVQLQVESDTSITVNANRSCFAMRIIA